MRRSSSLFAAVSALALFAAPFVSPASAFQYNVNSNPQNAFANSYAFGGSANSLALNNHTNNQGNISSGWGWGGGMGGVQTNINVNPQTAVSNAVSVFGNSSALAVNNHQNGQLNIK